MAKQIKKIVLVYSGGLDTSVVTSWLKENYEDCEIIAVAAGVGQGGGELAGLEEKTRKTGTPEPYIVDLKKIFIEDHIWPILKANVVCESKYLSGTSLVRPIITKRLVEIAKAKGADAICHGRTGKGNDQVRFELITKALALEMTVITPWRVWDAKSREEEIEYAESHNIPLSSTKEASYSKDKNLWHLSHESPNLGNPANELHYNREGFLELGISPERAPNEPTYITLSFEKGVPTKFDGEVLDGVVLIGKLNELGGKNGIDIVDLVENQLVDMKFRSVYETPGGVILYHTHNKLEEITLDKETYHYKRGIGLKSVDIVYNGQWSTPLRQALSAFVDSTQQYMTDDAGLKLYKGNIIDAGVTSLYSLHDEEAATFGEDQVYNQADTTGFINLLGPSLKVMAQKRKS